MATRAETGRSGQRPVIADVLREGIRQRLLAPGQPLIQAAIAEAMGVSRIPVREALHTLAAEGLVTFSDDGGAYVTELTAAEVDELWTLRALIESQMAPGIVNRATAADSEALRVLVTQMDDADPATWSDANFTFHEQLHRLSGLPHFADVARRVLMMIEPYSRVAVTILGAQGDAQAEHHQMLAALTARDEVELGRLLLDHSNRARKALMEYTTEQQQPSDRQTVTTEAARSLATRLAR